MATGHYAQHVDFQEIKIKLPTDIVNTISAQDIIHLLMDMALSKAEAYYSRCKQYEDKYNVEFAVYEKNIREASEESFSGWDDLIVWEGYELATKEWQKKYEELKQCLES